MKKIKGGVTAPKGFAAMGLKAGIKKDKKDMAMIYSSTPCVAAGTFTTNQVKAAPVKWDLKMIYENEKNRKDSDGDVSERRSDDRMSEKANRGFTGKRAKRRGNRNREQKQRNTGNFF